MCRGPLRLRTFSDGRDQLSLEVDYINYKHACEEVEREHLHSEFSQRDNLTFFLS